MGTKADLDQAKLHVNRLKNGEPLGSHYLEGDENPGSPQVYVAIYPEVVFLFFTSERLGPLSASAVHKLVARSGIEANLKLSGPTATCFDMEKGYELASKGVDTRAIQAYMGHKKTFQHTVSVHPAQSKSGLKALERMCGYRYWSHRPKTGVKDAIFKISPFSSSESTFWWGTLHRWHFDLQTRFWKLTLLKTERTRMFVNWLERTAQPKEIKTKDVKVIMMAVLIKRQWTYRKRSKGILWQKLKDI